MTFNLAKSRLGDEPAEDDKILKAVHKNKLKTRDASVQDDAGNIARLCAQTDQDPESVMDDDYWGWVRLHDKHYYHEVARKAKHIARQMRHEAANPSPDAKYVPAVPIPKKQEGPGGGGGMPAMGASKPIMFLKRNVGGYRLSGTIVGDLLSGELPFLKEDGTAFLMDVKDDSSVDRFGPSAIESLKMQEDIPEAMRSAAKNFLSSIGRKDASSLSRAIVARYLRKKKLDVLPLSVALKGERFGFLLRLGLEDEPSECQRLREEMGKAISPMISKLRDALLMDGIETTEVPAPMPSFTAQGKAAIEKMDIPFDDPSASPSTLTPEDVEDSIDVPSLVMTISSQETQEPTKTAAAGRLAEIICRLPKVYEKYELSDSDLKSIVAASGSSPAARRLAQFVRLFRADDAEVMEAYSSNESDRGLLAAMIVSQGRRNIIDAVPELCQQGDSIVPEFMSSIGASGSGLKFLESFVSPSSDCPEKIVSRKIIEAIWRNPDSDLLAKALESFPMARDFAILTIIEEKGFAEATGVLERIAGFHSGSSWHGVLLASACCKSGDDKVMKLAFFVTGARPIDVMEFAGRKATAAYMKANRIDPEGEPIPEAAEILSAPEDPLPLAKSLNAMGDHQAMLILLRACARRSRRGFAKQMWYAMSFMADALRAVGKGDVADEIMAASGVRVDDDSGTIKRVPKASRVASLNGRTLHGRHGVYVHDGVAYACDEETAAILPSLAEDFGPGREKK